MRKIAATLAVLWFLGVSGYCASVFFVEQCGGPGVGRLFMNCPIGSSEFFFLGVISIGGGIIAAVAISFIPSLLFIMFSKLWRMIAYEDEPHPLANTDMAPLIAAIHPKTGALVNAVQYMKTQSNRPPRPAVTPTTTIDSDKL